MNKIIGIITNNIELKQGIEDLFCEDVKQGRIIIDILDSERIEEQGRLLEKKGQSDYCQKRRLSSYRW